MTYFLIVKLCLIHGKFSSFTPLLSVLKVPKVYEPLEMFAEQTHSPHITLSKTLEFPCHRILKIIVTLQVRGDKLGTSSAIPEPLLSCYRQNSIDNLSEIPLTPRILIELLRRFENHKSEPSMKDLSNLLLHRVKFDGVQRISGVHGAEMPYRAAGKQFSLYKLLADHLTPSTSFTTPNFNDGNYTLCLLHLLLSNSFENPHFKTDFPYRKLLEQKGVMQTRWETVSPGFLIAALSTALHRDYVSLGKLMDDIDVLDKKEKERLRDASLERRRRIDNLLAATIGGVLAEVVLNQATFQFRITARGSWNDSQLPFRFYFRDYYWDSNDALLLGAIDALIVCNKIKSVYEMYPKIRMSQLIDMYYSTRGLFFDPTAKACNRRDKLNEALIDNELSSSIASISNLLQNVGYVGTTWADENILDHLSERVLFKFEAESARLISSVENCESGQTHTTGRSEVILIMDQFYDRFEFKRLLALLAEEADVSYLGTKMGIINGMDGTWMSNVTGQVLDLFENISQVVEWPIRLSLEESLKSVISYYQSKTASRECSRFARPHSQTVILLAKATRLSETDKANANGLLHTILHSHPHTEILFVVVVVSVTEEEKLDDFYEIARSHPGNCKLLKVNSDLTNTVTAIGAELKRMPSSIINIYCSNRRSKFQDYLTPNETFIYEIHSSFITLDNEIIVKFKGFYGDLLICAYDYESMIRRSTCKEITADNVEVTFSVRDHCASRRSCTVRFEASPKNSALRCTETDCRYLDQVRLQISTSWSSACVWHTTTIWHFVFLTLPLLLNNIAALLSSPSL